MRLAFLLSVLPACSMGNRFFVALTLTTVIVLAAGVFAGGFFSSVDGTSAAFLVSYGAANLVRARWVFWF